MAFISATEPHISFYTQGGQTLLASTQFTADAQGAAITVGKGLYHVVFNLTAEDTAIDDTNAGIAYVQANTVAAATTWVEIGCIPFRAASSGGAGGGVAAVGAHSIVVDNPYDHQLRVAFEAIGSPDITFSATIYPVIR